MGGEITALLHSRIPINECRKKEGKKRSSSGQHEGNSCCRQKSTERN